jgi:hypothetical protein
MCRRPALGKYGADTPRTPGRMLREDTLRAATNGSPEDGVLQSNTPDSSAARYTATALKLNEHRTSPM